MSRYSGCRATSGVSSFMFPLYVTPYSLYPQVSAPFSPTPLIFFRDIQLHYYIPFPSPHFILFAILPLYLIYISSPISIFSQHYLSFSPSLPSFSISSFVCYSGMYFPCLESPSTAIWSASCLGDTQTDLSSFWKTRGPAYWQLYF